jgi:hypothetical protein
MDEASSVQMKKRLCNQTENRAYFSSIFLAKVGVMSVAPFLDHAIDDSIKCQLRLFYGNAILLWRIRGLRFVLVDGKRKNLFYVSRIQLNIPNTRSLGQVRNKAKG